MADIELVIKIPEETVNEIKDNVMFAGTIPSEILWDVTGAIVNGIPLDKIRAEIKENINYNKKMNYQGIVAGLLLTLNIIDKYIEKHKEDIDG